ncbi:MAG TPA: hypothetical protein VHA57_06270, partial [Actinomycetota bacterium]|nr:hypothetical protein [Actinomycetota bacterium]
MSATVLTAVVVALVLAAAAVWILRPLQLPLARMATPDDDRWRELIETKHQLYRSILDLEFDQSVGKVSDADYLVLRRQQEGEAIAVLTELDRISAGQAADGRAAAAGGGAVDVEDRLEA